MPLVTTLPHHFPQSPLPFVTSSHHAPLPFLTTSLRHHTPFITTSLSHHTPFVTTSLRHHFPKSHSTLPSSPLPFITTSLGHHCPSSPPCVLAHYSFAMYDVLLCDVKSHSLTPPFINVKSHNSNLSHTALHQCQVSQFYLSVTRKIASQLPLTKWYMEALCASFAVQSSTGKYFGQQHCNSFAQSTHARAWLAHGACKFYRWERSYSISLRQLPPRLVRVLLVHSIVGRKFVPASCSAHEGNRRV